MVSDLEFVLQLRGTVSRYLRAVDGWDSAYRKFSHRRGHQSGVPAELDQAQAEYGAARRALESAIPRARRLGLRYGVRDPWPGLLRVRAGQSSIGRNERLAIVDCVDRLMAACTDDTADSGTFDDAPRSYFQRIKDYFL